MDKVTDGGERLESQRWPGGTVCPFCEQRATVKALPPEAMKNKKGEPQIGTLYERSHIPLHKWLLATHLMCSSKKSMNAHQLHRMLGITYKSAWFMAHRIREGMGPDKDGNDPIGGEGKVVESDETFVGGKARNAHKSKPIPKKHAVVAQVERDGEIRAHHVPDVAAKTVRKYLATSVDRASYLMTDESMVYVGVTKEFKGHSSVNHSADEYVPFGSFVHVSGAESFFPC
nr:IS1595 family transposase [Dichotomicrobium thermohalophilum]